LHIRPIRPGEHTELGRITVEAYRQLSGGDPLGSYEDELSAVSHRATDSVVLVAVDGAGDLLGGVTYVPDARRALADFADPDAAGIRMLAVRPQRQGCGIGRALTEACITLARAEGRGRVLLHSTPVMAAARRMYERLGFSRAPDLDSFVTGGPYATRLHLMGYVLELRNTG
jgi:ribosomal protein S18 acetylase RimI-like enzyme